jgi:hypothetical protein
MIEKMIILLGLLAGLNAEAALSELDKSVAAPRGNMLTNPGFEAGKAGWINFGAAGTYTTTSTSANRYEGAVSGSWDSDGSAQTFRSDLFSTHGRAGTNGVASCAFKAASGTATHTINVQDSLGATLATASLGVGTTYQRVSVNFPFGSSTSVRIVVASVASNEPELFIDSCYLGAAQDFNLFQVSQASFIGEGFIASTSGCTSTVTSTGTSLQDFPTTAACPGPTVVSNPGPGVLQTTDTDLPQFTFNNLPPGSYLAVMQGAVIKVTADGGNNLAISDGTTTSGQIAGPRIGTSVASTGPIMMAGNFNYTTTGNRTFKLQAFTETNGIRWINDSSAPNIGKLSIQLYRFPTSSETAARVDALPASWSGFHENNCSWSRTNTAYGDPSADATCTFTEQNNRNFGTVTSYLSGSDRLPGIVFTPSRAGRYLVLVDLGVSGSTAPATQSWRMETSAGVLIAEGSHVQSSGSGNYEVKYSLKGIVDASSTSPLTIRIQCKATAGNCQYVPAGAGGTIYWTVISLDQSFPSPLLVGSVTSASAGLIRTEHAVIGTTNDTTGCNTGTCTVFNASSSWISATRSGTGTYTYTISGFSGKPVCVCKHNRLASLNVACRVDSATTVSAYTANNADTAQDEPVSIHCQGPR